MPLSLSHHSRPAGFTLLEMSVVLVIIGVIVGGGMTIFAGSLQKRQFQETQFKMKAIQKALLDYRVANNRIPCPADVTQAMNATSNNYYGVEGATPGTCTGGTPAANWSNTVNSIGIVEGMAPVTTLRLPEDYAIDGWGRRIMYAVDKRFTAGGGFITYTITTAGGLTVTLSSAGLALSGTFTDPNFTTPGQGSNYTYCPGGSAWTFNPPGCTAGNGSVPGSGLQGNGSAWDAASAPVGVQTAFVQNLGSISQAVTFTGNTGSCTISFYAARRGDDGGNTNPINVNVDGSTIGTITPSSTSFSTYTTSSFSVSPGSHTIAFAATNGSSNGYSSFIDGVALNCGGVSSPAAVYTLISFGPNGHGSFPRGGGATNLDIVNSRISSGSVNTSELTNCDCTSSAVANGTVPAGTFVQMPWTQDPTTPNHTNDFDDVIVYATRAELASPTE